MGDGFPPSWGQAVRGKNGWGMGGSGGDLRRATTRSLFQKCRTSLRGWAMRGNNGVGGMGPRIRKRTTFLAHWGRSTRFLDSASPLGDMWSGEEEFSKVTNEVQHLVRMGPWESYIDKSPLKRGVRLPDYKPRGARSGRSLQIWIARHRQLLGS